jgi:hypothetical protein
MTLFPYTTLFRSLSHMDALWVANESIYKNPSDIALYF